MERVHCSSAVQSRFVRGAIYKNGMLRSSAADVNDVCQRTTIGRSSDLQAPDALWGIS